MGRYKLVVLSDATADREDEYNRWYSDEHLSDVVAVPGFTSAIRLKLHTVVGGEFKNRYLALYEMTDDDPAVTLELLQAVVDRGEMKISGALDEPGVQCAVFEVCSPEVAEPKASR